MTRTLNISRMLAAVIGASIAIAVQSCDRSPDVFAQPAPLCEGYTLAVGTISASDHEWTDPSGMAYTNIGEFSFQMRRAAPWFAYVEKYKGKPVKILLVPQEPRVLQQVSR